MRGKFTITHPTADQPRRRANLGMTTYGTALHILEDSGQALCFVNACYDSVPGFYSKTAYCRGCLSKAQRTGSGFRFESRA